MRKIPFCLCVTPNSLAKARNFELKVFFVKFLKSCPHRFHVLWVFVFRLSIFDEVAQSLVQLLLLLQRNAFGARHFVVAYCASLDGEVMGVGGYSHLNYVTKCGSFGATKCFALDHDG